MNTGQRTTVARRGILIRISDWFHTLLGKIICFFVLHASCGAIMVTGIWSREWVCIKQTDTDKIASGVTCVNLVAVLSALITFLCTIIVLVISRKRENPDAGPLQHFWPSLVVLSTSAAIIVSFFIVKTMRLVAALVVTITLLVHLILLVTLTFVRRVSGGSRDLRRVYYPFVVPDAIIAFLLLVVGFSMGVAVPYLSIKPRTTSCWNNISYALYGMGLALLSLVSALPEPRAEPGPGADPRPEAQVRGEARPVLELEALRDAAA